jgi:hypothetical protein
MRRSGAAIVLEVITAAAVVVLVLYVLFPPNYHRCQTPAPRWADRNSIYREALGEQLGAGRGEGDEGSGFVHQ